MYIKTIDDIPEEFRNTYINAGYLMDTPDTRRWTYRQKKEADEAEKIRLFANQSPIDDGRSRQYVGTCTDKNAAKRIAVEHNKTVEG